MRYVLAILVFLGFGGVVLAPPLAPAPEPERVSVLFGGDAMFDRYIRDVSDRRGGEYVFSCLTDTLRDADLVVVNLEGPITANESVSRSTRDGDHGHYQFTFPLRTAGLLYDHNVRVVNIGNNHIMNFGREGLLETKAALDYAQVEYFGDPDVSEAERVLRKDVEGVPLSFVNWSDWTSDKTDHTVAQVRAEKEVGRIPIVYAHWGDEYVPAPERTKVLARQFVDAGAVLVLGSHSHVVGEHEVYAGRDIYYSLGNFIFDQYFSDEVRTGALVRAVISSDGTVTTESIPIWLESDGRTCIR